MATTESQSDEDLVAKAIAGGLDELDALEHWREDIADDWSSVRFGTRTEAERRECLGVIDQVTRLARVALGRWPR